MKVLVVDDEPSVREILTLALTHSGHDVTAAADGREALERFRCESNDLVITDRRMPELDGEQLAAGIRALDPHIPILLVSGQCDGVRFPFDAILAKPFTPKTLKAAIDKAIAKRRQSAAHSFAA